ncbi:hypothetical protein Tco_1464073 [Tanacetum coccineum]
MRSMELQTSSSVESTSCMDNNSDSVNLPFELPTSEVTHGGSNASTSSHLGKHSTVRHDMNFVQDPTHEEIDKIVQNILDAHMVEPDHKTWTVISNGPNLNKKRLAFGGVKQVLL